MAFPQRRLRRLRRTPALRRLVAETRVTVDDLVAPLFVREGITEPQPIASLPGVVQHTRESLRKEVSELAALGIPGVILFGVPARKDAEGSGAWDPDGIVQLALADLRAEVGDEMVLIADLCVDEYTDHGHCGIVGPDGDVDNDATLELYARAAVAQADAGADITAPSGMMDGQVAAIRGALDGAGHTEHGDPRLRRQVRVGALRPVPRRRRRHHRRRRRPQGLPAGPAQRPRGAGRDPRRHRRGRRPDHGEARARLPRRDRRRPRRRPTCRVAAYHVSGEYSMIKAAAERGWIDGDAVALEHLTAIKRAGADVILTYLAREAAEGLLGPLTTNEELFERAQRVIPGGVNSPVRAFKSVGGTPYFVARAEGAHVWDVEGRRYIDLVQSYGAIIAGHAHPAIVEAVQRAAVDGTSYGAPTEREVLLAEAITRAGAVGGARAPRVVGHRGHHVGDPRGARPHRPAARS